MPNLFAYIVYWLWVPTSLFVLQRAKSLRVAATFLVLTAVLFLPTLVEINPPGLPPLDRERLTGLILLVWIGIVHRKRFFASRPGLGPESVAFLLILGSFFTIQDNAFPLFYGPRILPALSMHDFLATSLGILFDHFIPFFLGRFLFTSPRTLKDIFLPLATMGLIYTFPVLFELRFSPMLNLFIYGFHPHRFLETVRYGGFRPMVFLGGGLAVSFFLSSATLAAVTLARARIRVFNIPGKVLVSFLFIVLVGAKSLASIIYALVFLPLLFATSPRSQVRIAAILAFSILAFISLRITEAIPTDTIVSIASSINEERGASLKYRFDQEVGLINQAREKPIFGWGGYGRNLLFDEFTGQDISTPDGYWIILFGMSGIVGLYGSFLLILFPIFIAQRSLQKVPSKSEREFLAALSLLVAICGIDLIPNGLFTRLPYFFAGALFGAARGATRRSVRRSHSRPTPSQSSLQTFEAAPDSIAKYRHSGRRATH